MGKGETPKEPPEEVFLLCAIIWVMEKIIRKTKINWLITDATIVAFDKWQATLYHVYDTPNKQPLEEMKKEILKSDPCELNSWVEAINLSLKKGLRGYGTKLKEQWFES